MYLAADLVLNHSADDHAWALAARRGDARCRGFYCVFPDRALPDRFEAAMPEVFPETAPGNFTWIPEMGAWVMTVFNRYQWDLNWSNPELFLEMLDVLLGMANLGIDLIRLDAVPYLWKLPGGSCRNLPQAHVIVRLLKACADVVAPGVAFLAEAIVQPSEIVKYLDSGGVEECQMAYHASLMALLWESLATRKTRVLSMSFGEETRLPQGAAWLSYVRCHDDIGLGYDDSRIERAGFAPSAHRRFLLDFYSGRYPGSFAAGRLFMENPATSEARISGSCASLCGLESALASGDATATELALRRIELLYGLISSLTGIPMVFSGDELALRNDYSWEGVSELAEDNRWMHRPPMDWETAARRGLSGTIEARIFAWIKGCFAIRRGVPAFAQDAPFEIILSPSENVLLCLRRPKAGSAPSVLVAANFAPEVKSVAIAALGPHAGPGARDLLSGEALPPGRLARPRPLRNRLDRRRLFEFEAGLSERRQAKR
jgi:amylosucrase